MPAGKTEKSGKGRASGKAKAFTPASAAKKSPGTRAMTPEQEAALALADTIKVKEKAKRPVKPKATPQNALQGKTEELKTEPAKRGRPSKFDHAIAEEICQRLSDGEPLRQICRDEHMPHWTTVYDWIDSRPELSLRIARSRELGEEAISQECLAIADTPLLGEETEESENGTKIKRGDMLGHRRLQIETRLKLLAKWNPRKWGDKVDLNHGGQEGNPVNVATKVVIVPQKQTADVETKPLKKDMEG